MRIYFALFFLSLGFFIVHCEKETPAESEIKINTFYPDYHFQPLFIPQGIETSTDSMAQVIHGYFKLANSLEDYTRFCYFPPGDFEDISKNIKSTTKDGFNTWQVSFQRQGIEIYDVPVEVHLKVSENKTEYLWESYTSFKVTLPSSKVKGFNVRYIECGVNKDFKTGYMMKRFIWDDHVLDCDWEWEFDDESEIHNMSVLLNDLSKVDPDWPQPEILPGRADIIQNKSGSGEIKFYKIGDQKFIFHFSAHWDNLGNGQYQIYNPDASQIIHQGAW